MTHSLLFSYHLLRPAFRISAFFVRHLFRRVRIRSLFSSNYPCLIDLVDSWRLWCSECSWKYSWCVSVVETCLGKGTTQWYFDDENVWWINSATLCLHLPLPSDRVALEIHLSETTTSDGLTAESSGEIVHQSLSCLGINLATPRSNNESGIRVHKQLFQVIQD